MSARVCSSGGQKKNKKHINIFLAALAGQSSQGRTPTCPREKRDKMVILRGIQKRMAGLSQVCQWDGSRFVPGTGPVCSRDGSCLSRTPTPSRPNCFMFIGFVSCPNFAHCSRILFEQVAVARSVRGISSLTMREHEASFSRSLRDSKIL